LNEGSRYANDLIALKHYIFSHKTKQRNLKRKKKLQETPHFDNVFVVLHVSLLTVNVDSGMTGVLSVSTTQRNFFMGEVNEEAVQQPARTKAPKRLSLKGMHLLK
jgi:hypothetical protein